MRLLADRRLCVPQITAADPRAAAMQCAVASVCTLRKPYHTAGDLDIGIRADAAADPGAQPIRLRLVDRAAGHRNCGIMPPGSKAAVPLSDLDAAAAADPGAAFPAFGMDDMRLAADTNIAAVHMASAADPGAASVSVRGDIPALKDERPPLSGVSRDRIVRIAIAFGIFCTLCVIGACVICAFCDIGVFCIIGFFCCARFFCCAGGAGGF